MEMLLWELLSLYYESKGGAPHIYIQCQQQKCEGPQPLALIVPWELLSHRHLPILYIYIHGSRQIGMEKQNSCSQLQHSWDKALMMMIYSSCTSCPYYAIVQATPRGPLGTPQIIEHGGSKDPNGANLDIKFEVNLNTFNPFIHGPQA